VASETGRVERLIATAGANLSKPIFSTPLVRISRGCLPFLAHPALFTGDIDPGRAASQFVPTTSWEGAFLPSNPQTTKGKQRRSPEDRVV